MMMLWVAIMAVGLVGMIVCSKKQKSNPAMQPLAIVLFIVVLVGAGGLLNNMGIFGGANSSILDSEMRFAESRAAALAKFVAPTASGKKVLFIADQNFGQGDLGKRVLEAVKANCKAANFVVDSIPVPPEMANNGVPVEEFMKAKDLDALIEKHSDAAVVISNIGLPQDARKLAFFRKAADKRPMLALMNTGFAMNYDFLKGIQKGDIAAVIVTAPKAKYDIKAPSNLDEAFKIRYLLVTKDNAEQHKGQLPR